MGDFSINDFSLWVFREYRYWLTLADAKYTEMLVRNDYSISYVRHDRVGFLRKALEDYVTENEIKDLDMWISSLPTPGVDEKPPPVMASSRDMMRSGEDREYESQFVNMAKTVEQRAKYVLSSLAGADLRKDGDWVTIAGGRGIFQKKVADYVGGVRLAGTSYNSHLYVEVKSIAPGQKFNLARLDRSNTKGQKSQHEKLTRAMENGAFVWLVIGVWDQLPRAEPVIEKRKGRKYTRWKKEDVSLKLYVIDWKFWLEEFLPALGKKRSFGRKELEKLAGHCKIVKDGSQWKMHSRHWLRGVLS